MNKLFASLYSNYLCYSLSQVCELHFGSFYHLAEEMTFFLDYFVSWVGKDWGGANLANFPYQVALKGVEKNVSFEDNQAYSISGFELKLERYFMKHIMSYYFPSLIFVVVSWISFLIPPEIIPGRMALLITLLLVLVTMFATLTGIQPPSNSPTLLAIWITSCIIFVTAAIFAYAVLLFRQRYKTLEEVKSVTKVKPVKEKITQKEQNDHELNQTSLFDTNCLVLFRCVFLIFNFIYWPMVIIKYTALKS